MALTKIGKEGITGVSNSANATFLTATSAEGVTLAGTLAVTGVHTVGENAIYDSEGGAVTQNLVQGLAKAWVFGSDAAALTKSFNIASGTDNGTGDYTYAITNDMDSANFACTVSGAGGGRRYAVNMARAAGTFTLKLFDDNEAAADNPNAGKVHGDLA